MFERWRYGGILGEAFKLFKDMLRLTGEMFSRIQPLFTAETEAEKVLAELEALETESDKLHTSIRRKIVEYLSLVPGGDVIAALLLFAATQDAERLGDLAVNIAEAMELMHDKGRESSYMEEIKEFDRRLKRMFDLTYRAFCEQDEEAAREAVLMRAPIAAACNTLLARIVTDESITPARAVCLTLLERYFKRAAAHLYHIAIVVADPRSFIEHTKTPQPPQQKNS